MKFTLKSILIITLIIFCLFSSCKNNDTTIKSNDAITTDDLGGPFKIDISFPDESILT